MKPQDLVSDRYRLLRLIGRGAESVVWAARHELLHRELALKLTGAGTPAARARFLREVRIVGSLRHPNIVDIADAGDSGDGNLYLAMELLAGEPLSQRIARGPLSPAEALAITAEICRALAAAHAAGVIHRDIKPANIFLAQGPNGGIVPKLLDFGVSSTCDTLSGSGTPIYGTPAYMSPEQALGESKLDHRVDVWAMGVTLHEMLTGRRPFEAESYPALLPLIIEAPCPPLPAAIPAEVARVIAGCLAKARADRYGSAAALFEAVDRARDALPVSASRASDFVIEAGRGPLPSAIGATATAITPGPRRRASAIGVLAVLTALAIFAALGRSPGPAAPAAEPPPLPGASVPAPPAAPTASASAAQTALATSASALPPASAGARPRPAVDPRKPKVTRIDSAGF